MYVCIQFVCIQPRKTQRELCSWYIHWHTVFDILRWMLGTISLRIVDKCLSLLMELVEKNGLEHVNNKMMILGQVVYTRPKINQLWKAVEKRHNHARKKLWKSRVDSNNRLYNNRPLRMEAHPSVKHRTKKRLNYHVIPPWSRNLVNIWPVGLGRSSTRMEGY